jgi:superfamily II DNA or RNA helicase
MPAVPPPSNEYEDRMSTLALEMPSATPLPLRPYQAQAIEAILAAHERGVTRPLVVLPTGAGKTVAFSHLASRRPGRTLVLAHRDERLPLWGAA